MCIKLEWSWNISQQGGYGCGVHYAQMLPHHNHVAPAFQVLHFKVTSTPPGHLTQLATCVRRCFHGVGQSHDRRPFAPHVTIMKTSKLPHRQHGVYIDPALYEEIQDVHTHLGPVEVDCVHLCSMARPSGSYYPVVASMCLDEGGEVFVEEPWRARWGAWDETCREEWEETMMAN